MGSISLEGDTNVHGGAPFDTGLSSTVRMNNKRIVLVDQTTSSKNDDLYNSNPQAHPEGIAANQLAKGGSGTVKVEGKAVHRVGDPRLDGSTAGPGSSDVSTG